MTKKLAFILGGIALGLVALGVIVLLTVDVNAYRDVIESRLEGQLGRDIALGEMSLGLIPLRIEVADVHISEAAGFGNADFVSAERLAVRVGLLSLLGGNIEVASLDLERPVVELIRNGEDVWNFSTLSAAAGESTTEAPESGGGRGFALNRLSIRDGQIAVTDLGEDVRTVYDHIDLTLRNYAPGQPFAIDVAAQLPGEGAGGLRLTGNGGPVVTEDPMATPFSGALVLDEAGVEALKAFLDTEILGDSAGFLSGQTDLVNDAGNLEATGHMELEDARFRAVEVGYPIVADYTLGASLSDGVYTVDNSTVRLGDTPISLAGDIRTEPETRVDLHITADEISVSEVARLASAFDIAFAPGTDVTGRISLNVDVEGPPDALAFNGSIAGRDLRVSGRGAPQAVEIPAVDLALTPAEIRSNPFEVRSGDTTATARFALTGYTSDNPGIDAALEAPGATLPEIQSIARVYGITSLDQLEGTGSLDLDLSARGPLRELDSSSVVRALDGNIDLDFSPLSILGFNALSELGTIGGFTTGESQNGLTEVVRLTGHIAVDNGIARTDDLLASLAIGNIAAAGTAKLADETLDLRLSAVLSEAYSQSVGGAGVGGYLRTALTNNTGELVLPVRVTGSFQQPQFAPDLEAVARLQRERLLPTSDNPAAALSNILGVFRGGQTAPANSVDEGNRPEQEEETPPTPAETIRGILGGFLGGGNDPK